MMRAHLGTCVGAVAALALAPLAVTGASSATTRSAATSPVGARQSGHQSGHLSGHLSGHPTGHPTGHRADPSFGPPQRAAAVAQARQDRGTVARQLRLGARQALLVKDVQRDVDGIEHVRYERTYAGLPVVGGDLVVHQAADGTPRTTDWASPADISLGSTTPTVPASQVRGSRARVVVYAVGEAPVLAWESTVRGTEKDGTPIRDLVYTDAASGHQLGVYPQVQTDTGTGSSLYSGTVAVTTTKSGASWTLTDGSRGGHKTYDATGITSESDYTPGALFTDADNVWGNGATSSKQSAAVDAHYGAALTWDFYKNTFARTGIRNDGVAAFSRVHFGNSYENAFWDDSCFCMTYGDGGASLKALVSIDVAGHEMSHGVTAATDGLVYTGDAGGLNEATSDVMGTMVEFSANNASDPGDYYIGEKIMKDGTYLRRMDNPSADGASVNCWSTTTKNLDPHYSSGVGNHLFYLLSEGTGSKTIGGLPHSGTSCNGATLTGIGRSAAAAEWYRAMTTYWTSTTTYPQAANGMVKAAKDLYGTTSSQCIATVAAWKGVSVTPTETCTTGGTGSNLLANPGFESGATSWTSSSGVITSSTSGAPRSGSYYAWLDGYGSAHTDTLSQTVSVPAAAAATLSFYLRVDTAEVGSTAYDTLTVAVTSGTTTTTKATYSNVNATTGYVQKTIDLSAYTGKTITLKLTGVEDSSAATSFLVDDTSLTTG